MGPVETQIRKFLESDLAPLVHLDVVNESHLHAGHAHRGEESHFRIVAVSNIFDGLGRLERHRLIHKSLAAVLPSDGREGVHALTLELYSAQEWSSRASK